MIKMVFICLKNSFESRYMSFKQLFMALIKFEIDKRGGKCPKLYGYRPKWPEWSLKDRFLDQ